MTGGGAIALGELGDSLGFLLRVAQLRSFEHFYKRFGNVDLKPGEFSVMWVIRCNPGVRQGAVADLLEIAPAQMTKTVRKLEERGHIRREIPDDDRRSVMLELTVEGRAFTETHQSAFFSHDDHHNLDLSEEERRQLAALLRRYCGFPTGETA